MLLPDAASGRPAHGSCEAVRVAAEARSVKQYRQPQQPADVVFLPADCLEAVVLEARVFNEIGGGVSGGSSCSVRTTCRSW